MSLLLVLLLAAAPEAAAPEAPAPGAAAPRGPPQVARRQVPIAEAMTLAAKNNRDYAAAVAQAGAVQAQADKVYGAVLPEITMGGSYVHTSAPSSFDMGGIVGLTGAVYGLQPVNPGLIPGAFDIVAANSVYGNAQISQLLFTPQLFLLPASKTGVAAAKLGALEAREQVLLAVARVYLGLQGLAQIEAAATDAEAVALRRERDVQTQVTLGSQVEVALLRAKTETAQARTTLAQVAGQKATLLAVLDSLVVDRVAPLETPSTLPLPKSADAASKPWENTYLVRSGEQQVATQDTIVFYDSLMWLPTLVGFAKGNFNSNSGFTGKNWSYDLGLSLVIPLYDRGVRYATLHEDQAKLAGARARLDGDRLRAQASWETAMANLTAAEVALEQADLQSALATKAQKQAEAAFSLGLSTALELSDIDTRRFFAASQAGQARAQLEIRKVELVAAEGRLGQVLGLSTDVKTR